MAYKFVYEGLHLIDGEPERVGGEISDGMI